MITQLYTTEEKRQLDNLDIELQAQWIEEITRTLKKLAKKQTQTNMTKIQTIHAALTSPEHWQISLTPQGWKDTLDKSDQPLKIKTMLEATL